MNHEETARVLNAYRDSCRKLGMTRLVPVGFLVHNQGQAEGKLDLRIEVAGKGIAGPVGVMV